MKFEHFAINVEDPPAVAAWYVEHLQMQIVRHVGEPTHMHFLADSTGRVMMELYNNPPRSDSGLFRSGPAGLAYGLRS